MEVECTNCKYKNVSSLRLEEGGEILPMRCNECGIIFEGRMPEMLEISSSGRK